MYRDRKVVVVMPAYNAAKTLKRTYDEVMAQGIVDELIVVDDASSDDTVRIAAALPHTVVRVHEQNRGYGGNQKTCYRAALDAGADVVVMVHPDYQYTPRLLPAMVALVGGDVYPCVLGSRILGGCPPRRAFHRAPGESRARGHSRGPVSARRRGILRGRARRVSRLRRRRLRDAEPAGDRRPHPARGARRVHELPRGQLASADLALAHARRVALRPRPRGAPRDQRATARRERGARVPGARGAHRHALARGVRCGAVRAAPAARRVGRLGRGAQGRALGLLRARGPVVVGALRARGDPRELLGLGRAVRRGAAREADARDVPVPVAGARRLAARAARVGARCLAARAGEVAVLRACGGVVSRDPRGAGAGDEAGAVRAAARERGSRLRGVSAARR